MDALFLDDGKMERLGSEFGASAVAVTTALFCEARKQNTGGTVKSTYRRLAAASFVPEDEVRRVVSGAVQVFLIESRSDDGVEFVVFFPAWHRWQDAFRKANERAVKQG